MGVSTDAVLAYGYDLGSDGDLLIKETGRLQPAWFDPRGASFAVQAEERLLLGAGFAETDRRAGGYYERRRKAQWQVGVEVRRYGSDGTPGYILSAKTIIVPRGYVHPLDLTGLAAGPTGRGFDEKLSGALRALGITPKQDKPAWLLCSYWNG